MEWLELKADEASVKFDAYKDNNTIDHDKRYDELRTDLVAIFNDVLSSLKISPDEISEKRNSYNVDLLFGIRMFTTLNTKYGMNVRAASSDGVWRYLCVCVVPDLVKMRYGVDHPDRFWKKSKRLWLRVIWWYIYLSWQGSEKETYEVLKDNSTDEILQLVDRCGRGGYRVNLYRAIMKKNSEYDLNTRRQLELFRKMMKLNTARVQVIEPELVIGGCDAYVSELSYYFLR